MSKLLFKNYLITFTFIRFQRTTLSIPYKENLTVFAQMPLNQGLFLIRILSDSRVHSGALYRPGTMPLNTSDFRQNLPSDIFRGIVPGTKSSGASPHRRFLASGALYPVQKVQGHLLNDGF